MNLGGHKHSVCNTWLAKVGDQSRKEEVLLQSSTGTSSHHLQVPPMGAHTTHRTWVHFPITQREHNIQKASLPRPHYFFLPALGVARLNLGLNLKGEFNWESVGRRGNHG